MSKTNIFFLLLLAGFCACKTSTNPLDGQQLRLITSDPDTVSVFSGPVTFTLTVLQPSGYGASGAYINFYDPIEQRSRHEGPMPEDGELQITDTVSESSAGSYFEFAFVAEASGAITSDSVKLCVHQYGLKDWAIDSIEANSQDLGDVGVQWSRPSADTGTDTIFVRNEYSSQIPVYFARYPQNSAVISVSEDEADTIWVHNAVTSSQPIVWASANAYGFQPSGEDPFVLFEDADTVNYGNTGIVLSQGYSAPTNYFDNYYFAVDIMLAADPNNHNSGVTIISPSTSSMSGFPNGRKTAFYHVIQYIDNGSNLRQLYFSQDLSTYVKGVTPMNEIPLPDSSQYSTAFIAVTQDSNYALVSVGPVTHELIYGYRYVSTTAMYQPDIVLPYAGRGRKR